MKQYLPVKAASVFTGDSDFNLQNHAAAIHHGSAYQQLRSWRGRPFARVGLLFRNHHGQVVRSMRAWYKVLVLGLLLLGSSLYAQTHASLPLDHPVYYLLEQAQARGLCSALPWVKPYSRAVVLHALGEILDQEALPLAERRILEQVKADLEPQAPGLDLRRGSYAFTLPVKGGLRFSGNVGLGLRLGFSAGAYPASGDPALAMDSWVSGYTSGDVGERLSYNFTLSGGLLQSPRSELGTGYPYYTGFTADEVHRNEAFPVYSLPEAYFPYTYQKGWDGFLFNPGEITAGGMKNWPQELSLGVSLQSELAGELLGSNLRYRFGRLRREWAGLMPGSSLVLNAQARPFIALEGTFQPVSWFAFSALTGVLEYYNAQGISESAMTSQNAFSIEQVELGYKNYLRFSVGSTAVWLKRF
ncbi:MAG: hypothetical protein LBD74_04520, partial [Spirochaetaceae bacterium]|nr:hypothetical protein [Spirochaetaceae bacterium]